MLFQGLQLSTVLSYLIALLVAIPFHEFAHAWSATRLGDTTAQRAGRLTLNPAAHLEPVGTILLLTAGFGWGRPVPVNPNGFYKVSPKAGMALTSLAGPVSNLILAALFFIPFRLNAFPASMWTESAWLPSLPGIVSAIVIMNVSLAFFNLIPLPPLDGFKVVMGVMPNEIVRALMPLERYGSFLLLALFLVGPMIGFDVFDKVVGPAVQGFLSLLMLGM
jgi:Zn-dependent protease